MLIAVLTGLTYILRKSFKFHLFKGSMQLYRAICIIKMLIDSFFFMEKEEHTFYLTYLYSWFGFVVCSVMLRKSSNNKSRVN